MAALEQALQQRLQHQAEDRAQRQSSRVRLVADPSISVSSVQGVLTNFLVYKGTKDLWMLIAPPPGSPSSFSWHTQPQMDWLAKTAGLLWDLVSLAPNTKFLSSTLTKSLHNMISQNDLEVNVNKAKGQSTQAEVDRLDLTIRILLAMLRTIKCNPKERIRMQRQLGKSGCQALEMLLEKVTLPPEMLSGASDAVQEEKPVLLNTTVPKKDLEEVADNTAIVPFTGQTGKSAGAKTGGLRPLPKIFATINGKTETKTAQVESAGSTPCSTIKLPSFASQVLSSAQGYQPDASQVPTGKKKVQSAKGSTPKKNNHKKKTKKSKKTSQKAKNMKKEKTDSQMPKTKAISKADQKTASKEEDLLKEFKVVEYKPGDMNFHCDCFIAEYMANGKMSRAEAKEQWKTSLKRALLLKDVSLSELKRRRFVDKDCKSNPFARRVQEALKAKDVD